MTTTRDPKYDTEQIGFGPMKRQPNYLHAMFVVYAEFGRARVNGNNRATLLNPKRGKGAQKGGGGKLALRDIGQPILLFSVAVHLGLNQQVGIRRLAWHRHKTSTIRMAA